MAAATEASLRSYHGLDRLPESATPAQLPPPAANPAVATPPPPAPPTPPRRHLPTVAALPPPAQALKSSTGPATRVKPGEGASSGTKAVTFSASAAGPPTPLAQQQVAVGIPLGSSVQDTIALMKSNRTPPTTTNIMDGVSSAARAASAPHNATNATVATNWTNQASMQEDADHLLALQLQNENDDASLLLARQLQEEEDRRGAAASPSRAPAASANPAPVARPPPPNGAAPTRDTTAATGGSAAGSGAGCTMS